MGDRGLVVLGQAAFMLEGEVHQLVTFLNKTLKDRDLIFGLTRSEGVYSMTIYDSGPVNIAPGKEGE